MWKSDMWKRFHPDLSQRLTIQPLFRPLRLRHQRLIRMLRGLFMWALSSSDASPTGPRRKQRGLASTPFWCYLGTPPPPGLWFPCSLAACFFIGISQPFMLVWNNRFYTKIPWRAFLVQDIAVLQAVLGFESSDDMFNQFTCSKKDFHRLMRWDLSYESVRLMIGS